MKFYPIFLTALLASLLTGAGLVHIFHLSATNTEKKGKEIHIGAIYFVQGDEVKPAAQKFSDDKTVAKLKATIKKLTLRYDSLSIVVGEYWGREFEREVEKQYRMRNGRNEDFPILIVPDSGSYPIINNAINHLP